MDLVLTEEQELLAAHGARVRRPGARRCSASARCATRPTPTASRASSGREMAALGWLGIVLPEEHGGARPRLPGPDGRHGGARPRPHAGADALDRAPRRQRAPPRRQRRAAGASTCPRSPRGERLLALAYQERAEPLRPRTTSRRAPRRPAAAGCSAARRSRCSTATSPTGSSSRRAPPAAPRDADGHHALPRAAPTRPGVTRRAPVAASTAATPRSSASTTCASARDAVLGDVERRRRAPRARRRPRHRSALTAEMLGSMTRRLRDDPRVPEDARRSSASRSAASRRSSTAPRSMYVETRAGALGRHGRAPRARRGPRRRRRRARRQRRQGALLRRLHADRQRGACRCTAASA